MATIEFWGVMLFVIRSGKVMEVLFPDTRIDPPGSNAGKYPKKHHDGELARPHHAGFLHLRADCSEKSYDITDSQVVFAGGVHLIPAGDVGVMPDVSIASAGSLAHDDAAPVAATVSMRLPLQAAVTFVRTDKDFLMPGESEACPLAVRLTLDGDVTVCVACKGEQTSIQLRSGDTGIIHHSDLYRPSFEALRKPRPVQPKKGKVIDHDFKWLYSLAAPSPGKSHFKKTPLPAPTWTMPAPAPHMVPSVSTCFPGRIGK